MSDTFLLFISLWYFVTAAQETETPSKTKPTDQIKTKQNQTKPKQSLQGNITQFQKYIIKVTGKGEVRFEGKMAKNFPNCIKPINPAIQEGQQHNRSSISKENQSKAQHY